MLEIIGAIVVAYFVIVFVLPLVFCGLIAIMSAVLMPFLGSKKPITLDKR